MNGKRYCNMMNIYLSSIICHTMVKYFIRLKSINPSDKDLHYFKDLYTFIIKFDRIFKDYVNNTYNLDSNKFLDTLQAKNYYQGNESIDKFIFERNFEEENNSYKIIISKDIIANVYNTNYYFYFFR